MKWIILLAGIPSFAIAVLTVPLVRRLALHWGLMDQPAPRKVHARPQPLTGGIAIWAGVVLTFAILQLMLFAIPTRQNSASPATTNTSAVIEFVQQHAPGIQASQSRLWTLLGLATVMMLVGMADDRFALPWSWRLVLQIVAASVLVWQGWRLSLFVDFPALTFGLSVFWIVGTINSFNMLDNMDGLSGGVAWIAAMLLAIVMLATPDPATNGPQLFVAGFLAVLAGSIGGFLVYNAPPSSIFMGDSGSYLIGFLLAAATLMATFAGGQLPAHAVLAPLCVLAVPIYDTLSVIVIRLRQGRSPFEADQMHFSHRLVELGFSPRAAVGIICLLSTTCGLGALLLYQVDTLGAIVVLTMVGCVLVVIALLESTVRSRSD